MLGLGVATVVTLGVPFGAAVVDTTFWVVVGRGVFITVGTSVGETGVVVVAVASGGACCVVHPLAAIRSIASINNPIWIFMK